MRVASSSFPAAFHLCRRCGRTGRRDRLGTRRRDRGAGGSTGRGSVVLAVPAVPTLAGKVNEIAWAIVVEAAFQATAIWRNEFPVVFLPIRP